MARGRSVESILELTTGETLDQGDLLGFERKIQRLLQVISNPLELVKLESFLVEIYQQSQSHPRKYLRHIEILERLLLPRLSALLSLRLKGRDAWIVESMLTTITLFSRNQELLSTLESLMPELLRTRLPEIKYLEVYKILASSHFTREQFLLHLKEIVIELSQLYKRDKFALKHLFFAVTSTSFSETEMALLEKRGHPFIRNQREIQRNSGEFILEILKHAFGDFIPPTLQREYVRQWLTPSETQKKKLSHAYDNAYFFIRNFLHNSQSPRELYRDFGLVQFTRYPVNDLQTQSERWKKGKRFTLFLTDWEDWNTALSNVGFKVSNENTPKDQEVIFIEGSSFGEMLLRLKKLFAQKTHPFEIVDVVVFSHGEPNGAFSRSRRLSNESLLESLTDPRQQRQRDELLALLRAHMTPSARILLSSCSTGKKLSPRHMPIAGGLAKATQRDVVAPTDDSWSQFEWKRGRIHVDYFTDLNSQNGDEIAPVPARRFGPNGKVKRTIR